MANIREKLREYGADSEKTMNRFVDDEELYIACLSDFFGEKDVERLGEAISAKDYKTAFEYAHSIKGVSGNLGLDPVYNAACELVEPLRRDETDNAEPLFEILKMEFERAKKFFQ